MTKTTRKRIAGRRKKNTGGGRHVSPQVTEQMNAVGYISPAEAMTLAGVRGGTVYGWVARGVLKAPEGDERKPWIRSGSGNLWLLRDAVVAMRAPVMTEPAP